MVFAFGNVPIKLNFRFGRAQGRGPLYLVEPTSSARPVRSEKCRLGHQLSALIAKSKATRRRLRDFNLVLVTSPHAGYTSAEPARISRDRLTAHARRMHDQCKGSDHIICGPAIHRSLSVCTRANPERLLA